MTRRSLAVLALGGGAAAALLAADKKKDEKGFVPIFDGKTLNGWKLVKPSGPGYIVKDGTIICPEDGGGNLFTEKEYANFILRFEFKLSPGGNNGIGIRAPMTGDVAYSGMEIQVLDHDHPMYHKPGQELKDWQYHGSVYNLVAAKGRNLKPQGEWNEEEILVDGRRVVVTLNGKVINDANLDSVKDPELLKKHPGIARTSGHIGLLGHHSHVEFRNMRVKTLP
ncbi:hypothetical protein F183_A08890 [Bryobacterales bacterium F-183]|nr:hypothetical protein F183_A08890 [Bryobacterales bacterium F-183]